ncbi:MAG: polymerase sigma factor [Chthonomonadaceae bacterium]|nr:polymerase sigma factor [Chthonomonadaceae bacterium]
MTQIQTNVPETNGADGIRPLTSGKRYREPEVVVQIDALRRCGRSEFRRRVEIRDHTRPGFVSEEALVYFVRDLHLSGRSAEAGDLIELLEERCRKRVARTLTGWSQLTVTQRDDCYNDLISQMFVALISMETKDEFWEVRFWHCLDWKLSNIAQKYHAIAQNEFVPEGGRSDEGKSFDYMANVAAPVRLTSEERVLVQEALRILTPEQRVVFILFHYEQWTQEEIATHAKVTDRTVRNRLESAEKRLASWRADAPL